MKKIVLFLFVIIGSCVVTGSMAQDKTGMHIINTFHITSPGGWDYIEVGPLHDWLYVSHGNQVNVINYKTGDSAGIVENTGGVHGIGFDQASGKGYTSNGKTNTLTVFDLNTNKVLGQVSVGQGPDAIFFDPYSKKIITCNGRSKNLSIIDTKTDKLTDSVDIGGRPETAVSDEAGRIYVNLEDKNQIAVVDTKTWKVINTWSLAPGDGPTGLAIDRATHRLFSGCDKLLVVMDATNGKIIDKLTIGDGCDGVVFDPGTKNVYTSNGEGTITVIHEESANKFSVVDNIKTKRSARTIAINKETHRLYLPAADFEPMEPGQKGRPKMKPGSFQVIEVGK